MNIEERLTRIEAHLFGKAEQAKKDMSVQNKPVFQKGPDTFCDWMSFQPQETESPFDKLVSGVINIKPKLPNTFFVHCKFEERTEVLRLLGRAGFKPWKYSQNNGWSAWCTGVRVDSKRGYWFDMGGGIDSTTISIDELREKFGVEQPQEKLRDFVVPLAHATLTREEVAERCIAAAENKGYRADPDPEWSTLIGSDESGMDADHFFANTGSDGYAFHNHECDPHPITTLEAFEEYCGVEQPLPSGNSEKPNTHEPTEKPVYEAGFWWNNVTNLNLPDGSVFFLGIISNVWQKLVRSVPRSGRPHTITPVSQHTVGKFYALAGASGAHLNDYRNYALCVAVGDTNMFVRASTEYGVVLVERARERDVTLNEVTPV